MTYDRKKNICNFMTAILAVLVLGGCQVGSQPRLRISDFFGDPAGMVFADPDNLGPHCLTPCHDEKLGMLYTCKAGFIDLGHLREAADRTHYAAGIVYQNLLYSKKDFSYRIIEPSWYHVAVHYPDNWSSLPVDQRQKIAREVAVLYGQYLAHTSLIWHEILTWYGFSSAGIFPENISAFSWEDPYSDVLGTHLAVKALGNPHEPYEEAMARLIDETLRKLDVQPAATAKQAAQKVHGKWFEGDYYFFVKMKKRNLDVGLDDGMVTPWLVPGMCPDAQPQSCPAPRPSDVLDKYGFKMRLEIEPVEFEKASIYKAIHLKPSEFIRPSIHFLQIIEQIRNEGRGKEGADMDVCPQQNSLQKQISDTTHKG